MSHSGKLETPGASMNPSSDDVMRGIRASRLRRVLRRKDLSSIRTRRLSPDSLLLEP